MSWIEVSRDNILSPSVSAMSSDATATLFSKSCLAQREEPQSKLDSISSGLGATLVITPIPYPQKIAKSRSSSD
jgi:hypothetical protein